jgi:hypothetical protein
MAIPDARQLPSAMDASPAARCPRAPGVGRRGAPPATAERPSRDAPPGAGRIRGATRTRSQAAHRGRGSTCSRYARIPGTTEMLGATSPTIRPLQCGYRSWFTGSSPLFAQQLGDMDGDHPLSHRPAGAEKPSPLASHVIGRGRAGRPRGGGAGPTASRRAGSRIGYGCPRRPRPPAGAAWRRAPAHPRRPPRLRARCRTT